MSEKKILVAGIGNIFFGDDAFGCEVIKKLAGKNSLPHVKLVDFGIKTRELAFELSDGCDLLIVVDAVVRGEKPGTLYLIELPTNDFDKQQIAPGHDLKLRETFAFAGELGAKIDKILLVGCEPENFDCENLSRAVSLATEEAVKLINNIISNQVSDVDPN